MTRSPKDEWVFKLPEGRADHRVLADVVDSDGGNDEVENELYEQAADPQRVQEESVQRRFRGAYLRRQRRLVARSKDVK